MTRKGRGHPRHCPLVVIATVDSHMGHGGASGPFLFFQTKCRDNTCVQCSLLTFGNDSPLYGRPNGEAVLTAMCVIHTVHSHNTGLQRRWTYRKAACQGWRKRRGGVGSWRERAGLRGAATFIHPHSSSPPFSCCYLPLWSRAEGGCSGAQYGSVQWVKGGVWGALHAILVKGWERHARHTRLLAGLFPCLDVTTPTTDCFRPRSLTPFFSCKT